MSKFRFKLEFLLRYRRQKEEMAMLELAKHTREAGQVRQEIEEYRTRTRTVSETLSQKAREPIPAAEFSLYKDYQGYLVKKSRMAEARLEQVNRRVREQREKLIEAGVQRKIMETHKQNQKETHDLAEALQEQKVLDELTILARLRGKDEKA